MADQQSDSDTDQEFMGESTNLESINAFRNTFSNEKKQSGWVDIIAS